MRFRVLLLAAALAPLPASASMTECTIEATPDHVVVRGPGGDVRLDVTGEDARVEPVSGEDIDQDDAIEIVVRTREPEGGYRYRVTRCGETPSPGPEFTARYPVVFERARHDRMIFAMKDTRFAVLPELADVATQERVLPTRRLALAGPKFQDWGGRRRADYDREIRDARERLTPARIRQFRAGTLGDDSERSFVAARVLQVALSYLNSGREAQAWKELDREWPADDVERVKAAILDASSRG